MPVNPEIKPPWERIPEETDRSFGGFMVFINMGTGNRSIDGAYRLFMGKTDERAAPYFSTWARENRWFERAAAYDAEVLRQAREQVIAREAEEQMKWFARRRELIEREWRQANAIADKVDAMLALPITEKTLTDPTIVTDEKGQRIVQYTIIKPAGWKLRDVERLAERASVLQRRAADMAQSFSEVSVTGLPDAAQALTAEQGVSTNDRPQTLGRANLPFEVAVALARQLVSILTARFPERTRADILASAARESGVPLALLTVGEQPEESIQD